MHRSATIPNGAVLFTRRAGHACASRVQSSRYTTTPLRNAAHDSKQPHHTTTEGDRNPRPPPPQQQQQQQQTQSTQANPPDQKRKTVAERDAELQARLEDMSGDGGVAGIEYENGTAEGLKKEVKRNMFRVI